MLYNVILTTYQFPRIPLKLAELHKKFTNLKTAAMLPPFGDGFPIHSPSFCSIQRWGFLNMGYLQGKPWRRRNLY